MKTIIIDHKNDLHLVASCPTVAALGFFDGVHLGHQKVIQTAKKLAEKIGLKTAVISFFPHPKEIIGKTGERVHYLLPPAEKAKKFSRLGVDYFYLIRFTPEFARVESKDFVQKYLIPLQIKHVVAGYDFTYGRKGKGNLDTMEEESGYSITVTKVENVERNDEKISSTLIRNKIQLGFMEALPNYLGEFYETKGKMVCTEGKAELIWDRYYMLPPEGCYDVAIYKGHGWVEGRVLITDQQKTYWLGPSIPSAWSVFRVKAKWISRNIRFISEIVEAPGKKLVSIRG
ncbi:riboflavin kinase/FMN adenylyltransferase [Anoxybacillus vitaminiphilus]|uniref:FAD synthase n=1 Tax=Paranoxybacillus vitaminiphilus TaxID=581036 RepID=A0A327Y3F6_9BACL|nr:FAD synthetase family protein [Anoxybacillus vitaminiphilus]RAK14957.1 riboflavin kinase/FMN adenylyltransferase [Anoxybacillus vitaminiphilus]